MTWSIAFHKAFEAEFVEFPLGVKERLVASATLLATHGPMLGRPHADTLNGSKHANMKELRFKADNGAWRVAFAFDPARRAILLVGGNKAGMAQRRFYSVLTAKADARFTEYLETLEG